MIKRNRIVNFAAVVDKHGKLLFGQSSTKNCAACIRGAEAIKSLSSPNGALCSCRPKNKEYQFFNNCLVPVIRLSSIAERDASNKAQGKLMPLYDMMISPLNKFAKIGIIPLNKRRDKFLCVYIHDRDIKTQIIAYD